MVFQKLEERVRNLILVSGIGLAVALQPTIVYGKEVIKDNISAKVQYDSEHSLTNKLIQGGKSFIGYAKTVKNKELIKEIERTYNISIDTVLDIMAQESSFKIIPDKPPKYGEKGTSQTKRERADELVKRMRDKNDSLYFPDFDFSNYRFEMLDRSYDLNTLMVAANLKDGEDYITKNGISVDDIFKKMRESGVKEETYKKIKIKKKATKQKRIKQCVDFWKNNSEPYKETVVSYIAYNGGKGALLRMNNKKPSNEIVYHAALLMKNAEYFRRYKKLIE